MKNLYLYILKAFIITYHLHYRRLKHYLTLFLSLKRNKFFKRYVEVLVKEYII